MALLHDSGTLQTPTGTVPPYDLQTTHSLGTTPKILICRSHTNISGTSHGVVDNYASQSMGVAVATGQGSSSCGSIGISNSGFGTGGAITNLYCTHHQNLGSPPESAGYVLSWDADDFTLRFPVVDPFQPRHVHWDVLAGFQDAKTAFGESPAGGSPPVALSVAHGGSTAPDVVLVFSQHALTSLPGAGVLYGLSVGMWDGSTQGHSGVYMRRISGEFRGYATQDLTKVIKLINDSTGTVEEQATISSVDATNVNFSFDVVKAAQFDFFIVSLWGVDGDLVEDTVRTSTTGTKDTSFAFTPEFIFLTSFQKTANGADASMVLGSGSDSSGLGDWCANDDGNATNGNADSKCGANIVQMCQLGVDSANPTDEVLANLDSTTPFPSNAMRLDYTLVGSTAYEFLALALKEKPSDATPKFHAAPSYHWRRRVIGY